MLLAMQTHLASAEDLHPDWNDSLLKFHLRYARIFQLKCEGQPQRHAGMLEMTEYQEAARRVSQLQQEYHLWLSRREGCHRLRKDGFERMAQHYLMTRRNQRHATLYVEHFAARPPMLISALIQPPFQAHEVAFPGLGLPDQWAYITGAGKARDDLQKEIQSAVVWLTG